MSCPLSYKGFLEKELERRQNLKPQINMAEKLSLDKYYEYNIKRKDRHQYVDRSVELLPQ